jgi:hypothetical protein
MPDRSLIDWLKIAAEVKAKYDAFDASLVDKRLTRAQFVDMALPAAGDVLDLLIERGVTLEELSTLAKTVGPLLPLLTRL